MKVDESQQLIDFLTANAPQLDADLPTIREQFDKMVALQTVPADCTAEQVSAGGVPAVWITVPQARNDAVLLYLHGGGYMIGSAKAYAGLAAAIGKAAGMNVLVPDYRLGPEHPFPAPIDDAMTAYGWLVNQTTQARSIVVSGDSAGGGLTMALLHQLRERQMAYPCGVSLISPWIDLKMQGKSVASKAAVDLVLPLDALTAMAGAALGGAAMPAYLDTLNANLTGYPPVQIQVGSHEILLDDACRLATCLGAANVSVQLRVWPGMMHDWPLFAQVLSDGRAAIERIGNFARVCCTRE
jgi:acetyl esterase/lipase